MNILIASRIGRPMFIRWKAGFQPFFDIRSRIATSCSSSSDDTCKPHLTQEEFALVNAVKDFTLFFI